jgi:hypothetical protein
MVARATATVTSLAGASGLSVDAVDVYDSRPVPPPLTLPSDPSSAVRYEAENGVITHARVVSDPLASAGAKVGGLDFADSSVTLTVNAAKAGPTDRPTQRRFIAAGLEARAACALCPCAQDHRRPDRRSRLRRQLGHAYRERGQGRSDDPRYPVRQWLTRRQRLPGCGDGRGNSERPLRRHRRLPEHDLGQLTGHALLGTPASRHQHGHVHEEDVLHRTRRCRRLLTDPLSDVSSLPVWRLGPLARFALALRIIDGRIGVVGIQVLSSSLRLATEQVGLVAGERHEPIDPEHEDGGDHAIDPPRNR